jgi:hypothetical protein
LEKPAAFVSYPVDGGRRSPESLIHIYQTTRSHNLEDRDLNTVTYQRFA